jgi:hypothetical protein
MACGGSGEPLTPYVDFECSSAQALICSPIGVGRPVFVGLTRTPGFNCESALTGLPFSVARASFEFSGTATANWTGLVLSGIVKSWVNIGGGPIETIPSDDYTVCIVIDADSSGTLSINDALASDTINPRQNFLPIANWIEI